MEDLTRPQTEETEPELKQPDETVKDLEPEKEAGEKVKGGFVIKGNNV